MLHGRALARDGGSTADQADRLHLDEQPLCALDGVLGLALAGVDQEQAHCAREGYALLAREVEDHPAVELEVADDRLVLAEAELQIVRPVVHGLAKLLGDCPLALRLQGFAQLVQHLRDRHDELASARPVKRGHQEGRHDSAASLASHQSFSTATLSRVSQISCSSGSSRPAMSETLVKMVTLQSFTESSWAAVPLSASVRSRIPTRSPSGSVNVSGSKMHLQFGVDGWLAPPAAVGQAAVKSVGVASRPAP